jgi:hypothetical protein
MSISMERFESSGQFVTYDPFAKALSRVAIFQLQCRCCGYEPEDSVVAPKALPEVSWGDVREVCPPREHPRQRQSILILRDRQSDVARR